MPQNRKPNNLIMPKGDGTLEATFGSLEVYQSAQDEGTPWYPNKLFKPKIADALSLPKNSDGPFLIKKSEVAKYFGLIDYIPDKKVGRITPNGTKFIRAVRNKDTNLQINLVFNALTTNKFGKENCAVPGSDSIIEPPILFLKALYLLKFLSKKEFKNLLYLVHDEAIPFETAIDFIHNHRENSSYVIPARLENKYNDIKFIPFFQNLGLIEYDKSYVLSKYVYENYGDLIKGLSIYNNQPQPATTEYTENELEELLSGISDQALIDVIEENYENNRISRVSAYDTSSNDFAYQNSRMPILNTGTSGKRKYKTNPRISKTSIELADHKCQHNPQHKTFISNSYKLPYMEAHHLLPMKYQDKFPNINIDRVENIFSLCPICHSAIHYGTAEEKKSIIHGLYGKSKESWHRIGLELSEEQLIELY